MHNQNHIFLFTSSGEANTLVVFQNFPKASIPLLTNHFLCIYSMDNLCSSLQLTHQTLTIAVFHLLLTPSSWPLFLGSSTSPVPTLSSGARVCLTMLIELPKVNSWPSDLSSWHVILSLLSPNFPYKYFQLQWIMNMRTEILALHSLCHSAQHCSHFFTIFFYFWFLYDTSKEVLYFKRLNSSTLIQSKYELRRQWTKEQVEL
jgi:hypothetical protein